MSAGKQPRKGVIPAAGVVGARLVEAAATEVRTVIDLVRTAVQKAVGRDWLAVAAVYPDRLVVEFDGRQQAYPFTLNEDNTVQLGTPFEVVMTHQPVRVVEARADGQVGAFIEAVGEPAGGIWTIRVIKAGESTNGNYYGDAALKGLVRLLEGVRVFEKSDAEHVADLKHGVAPGKSVRNLVGALTNARFVEGAAPDTGEIQADLKLIQPDGEVAVRVREAHARDLSHLFGFSIDADSVVKTIRRGNRRLREATKFTKVRSVDLIVEPGAGGSLLRIVEARMPQEDEDMALRQRMIEAVRAHNPKFDCDSATDDELVDAYDAALAAGRVTEAAGAGASAEALNAVRLVECRMVARDLIGAAKLPVPAKERLMQRFTEATQPFDAAAVTNAIEAERQYLARFTESGKPAIHFDEAIEVEDRSKKVADMFDAFFDPAHKDHRQVQSFRECYIEVTGDRRVTGRLEQCDMVRLRESLGARFVEATMTSATFSHALGDSITRRMLADYRAQSQYDVWRMAANVVPVADFRTQERTRWGGFGDLPVVAEGADYQDGGIPDDEVATYKAAKSGRLSRVTLEMIRNDDVGMVRQIPIKLSRAAKRTLAKFVLDFIRTNPVIYDSKALFHADHGNLGAAALSAASWAAARLAMMQQTEAGSEERLGIPPRNLWVPADLEETAFDLFKQRGTNNDQSFIQTQAPRVIPVWYWTDANDWAASCDPLDVPTIEIGFLDGNEEPEIFVQDNPSVGSLFANDTITYKIRHVYGGGVMDFRGLYKAVVA
ncbi:MAG: hypothetical protein ACK4KV_19015 [Rhodocyclaceae bacterium]